MKKGYELPCNIAESLNIVGDRWTLLIILQILLGNTTFNGIKHALNGVSASVLAERLRMLEEDALIASRLYSAHPPRYEYRLTPSG